MAAKICFPYLLAIFGCRHEQHGLLVKDVTFWLEVVNANLRKKT